MKGNKFSLKHSGKKIKSSLSRDPQLEIRNFLQLIENGLRYRQK